MGRREKNDYERGSEAPQVLYSPLSYGDNLHYEKFSNGSVKCIEDEIPFDIPGSWAWVRISSICVINPKNDLNDDTEVSFIPMPHICEGYENRHSFDIRKWSEIKTGYTHFAENDIGIAKITPCFENRKSVVFHNLKNGAGAGTTELFILRPIISVEPDYLLWIAKTDDFINGGVETFSAAVGQQRVDRDFIVNYLIPLPPVNEQKSIINKINVAFSVINTVDQNKADLANTIFYAKSKILDLAIRGQLVPQNPDDEPASVLLERIRAEKEELIKQGKIKRDKKESFIFRGEDNSYYEKIDMEVRCINSEIPFDLPETWCWCRLGTLFAHNTGKALNSADSAGTPMTYITTSNLYWDRFELDSLKEMLFADSEIDKCTVKKGDLLVCEGGDIGRSAIWMFEENIRIQNHIHRLRPYISLSNRFYYYVMYMWKQLGLIGGQGIGLQGFSSKMLHNLIVPLPSIDEQERIVAFIDKLFEQIESIEKSFS